VTKVQSHTITTIDIDEDELKGLITDYVNKGQGIMITPDMIQIWTREHDDWNTGSSGAIIRIHS
jgi:hypothetical protein